MNLKFKDGTEFNGSIDEWNLVKKMGCFPQDEDILDAEKIESFPEIKKVDSVNSSKRKKGQHYDYDAMIKFILGENHGSVSLTKFSRKFGLTKKSSSLYTVYRFLENRGIVRVGKKRVRLEVNESYQGHPKHKKPRGYIRPDYKGMVDLIKSRKNESFTTQWHHITQAFNVGTEWYVKEALGRLGVKVEGKDDNAFLSIEANKCPRLNLSDIPAFYGVGDQNPDMKRIVMEMIYEMALKKSKMTYSIEGQFIGLNTLDEWNNFCRGILKDSNMIENLLGLGTKNIKIQSSKNGFVIRCY